jgi:hypothetical protein
MDRKSMETIWPVTSDCPADSFRIAKIALDIKIRFDKQFRDSSTRPTWEPHNLVSFASNGTTGA